MGLSNQSNCKKRYAIVCALLCWCAIICQLFLLIQKTGSTRAGNVASVLQLLYHTNKYLGAVVLPHI
jgi:hypothetical protein